MSRSRSGLAAAFADLDSFVAERMNADGTPGVAVALTDRNGTLHVGTYGWADRAAGVPVTPETLFEIGSIGKSFTADALLILAERGAVDLDAPVTRYLPWFAVRSRFGPIALRHLLAHTAGIIAGPDGSPSGEGEVWLLRETETSSPPGDRFHYSNVGYKALGLVVAEVSGRTYPEAIREFLLDPLGMEASEPAITNAMRHKLAVGYTGRYDDRPYQPHHPLVPATWLETDTGDGCLACSAADLAAYARMLLNRGRGPAGPVLSEASFARKIAPHAVVNPRYAYGFGAWIESDGERTRFGHSGGMVGYIAHLFVDPDAGFGVAVLMNGLGSTDDIADYALDALRAVAAGNDPRSSSTDMDEASAAVVGAFRRVEGNGPDEVAIEDGVPAGDLVLRVGGERIPLLRESDEALLADHPALSRFRFVVERDDDGRPVALAHGGTWYAAQGVAVPEAQELPPEWAAFPGHYRSHNPWCPSFDVVARRGRLRLLFGIEPDGFETDQPLVPLEGDGVFRAGEDPAGPEFVAFDAPAGGVALRATLSGCPFWRVRDP